MAPCGEDFHNGRHVPPNDSDRYRLVGVDLLEKQPQVIEVVDIETIDAIDHVAPLNTQAIGRAAPLDLRHQQAAVHRQTKVAGQLPGDDPKRQPEQVPRQALPVGSGFGLDREGKVHGLVASQAPQVGRLPAGQAQHPAGKIGDLAGLLPVEGHDAVPRAKLALSRRARTYALDEDLRLAGGAAVDYLGPEHHPIDPLEVQQAWQLPGQRLDRHGEADVLRVRREWPC